jgi:hypothetical protein
MGRWTREMVIYEAFSTALILRGTYLHHDLRAALADERRSRLGLTAEDHADFVRQMAEDDAIYHEVVFSADSGMAAARDFGTEDGWHIRLTADGVDQPLVTVFRERRPNPLQIALYTHMNRWSDLWIARFGKSVAQPKEVVFQVGSGYVTDNERYPWRMPIAQGGSSTRTRAFYTFQCLSNELALTVLLCPSDTNAIARDWASLWDTNVSYFVGVDTKEGRPGMFLVGDRNIEGGRPNQSCPVADVSGVTMAMGIAEIPKVYWTARQHRGGGNVSMGDGRAVQVTVQATKALLYASDDDPGGSFNNHILKPR